MAEPRIPGPGRSTSTATFDEITKEIARRNEETQKVARKARTVRDKDVIARRRGWDDFRS